MLPEIGASGAKTLILIGVLALVILLESFFPFFKNWKGKLRHGRRNLGIDLFNGLIIALIFSTLTASVVGMAQQAHFGLLEAFDGPLWIKTVFALVLFDLWMYLWHRINHRIPFLWRFHRMHHSDNQVDATSALRFHTVELIFSSLLRLAVIPLLGLSFAQVILYEICLQPFIIFHHSNVALPEVWDRLLRIVIVTPNMHRVHHSTIPNETDSNYASIFSFWDRLGKSFRRREDFASLKFGLTDFPEEKWQTFLGMLKTPLK